MTAAPERTAARVRRRARVTGIVQGVGFRPFVAGLAAQHGLGGLVGNDTSGVFLEVEGAPDDVAAFLLDVSRRAPALAVVESVESEPVPVRGDTSFVIAASTAGTGHDALVAPDTATCDECLREMDDPSDRRFGYPFVNCTACGPRFTIVTGVPYDRPSTTMAPFPMCADCTREYADPHDRRYHAQPVCCPACGPTLRLVPARDGGTVESEHVVAAAAELLLGGAVLAVKGIGGYHLAVVAGDETAVSVLRSRKHREDRPFALMAADVEAVDRLAVVDDAATAALVDRRRPIVLLPRRDDAPVAPSVAPGNRYLGVMLPYTGLHHLLLRAVGRPLVLTSGNVSDEPIAHDDTDARERLGPIADAFVVHDRAIHTRVDDSVVRVTGGSVVPVRRSRGFAPAPLPLPWAAPRHVLACGAELKNVFAVAKDRRAFLSHHIGDLTNLETLTAFTAGVDHLQRLFDVRPEVVAHDLHPDYLSTRYALDLDGVETVGVQHHHAHVASCLADNGETGPVVGVALDGLGYGTDGTLWGGEVLVADLVDFERAGHLEPVPQPGGDAATREPWRMAASFLRSAFGPDLPSGLAVAARHADRWDAVLSVAASAEHAPLTSSAGRLFDAVSALLGVRDAVTYEGQAAVELEQRVDLAALSVPGGYVAAVDGGVLRSTDLVRAVVRDVLAGVDPGVVAARFHAGLAAGVVSLAAQVAADRGLSTVALSGGVFQNVVLTAAVADGLTARGLRVLTHSRVPPNDGGIAYGQVAVAVARDRAGR